jgi:protein-disulfide isomerase
MKFISRVLYLTLFALVVAVAARASGQMANLKPEQCLGGKPDAPIRVEVFSDFECPACKQLYLETMRLVLKDYCIPEKVCLVYHEFPLQGHKHSRQAARYTKAAQKMNQKAWQTLVEAFFVNQEKWSQDGSVDDIAFKALGADQYFNLKKLLLDPAIETEIDAEVAMGQKLDVQSTPTFFVYALNKEQKVVGFLPYLMLKDFFDRIVK